jgi:flavorubredoxin
MAGEPKRLGDPIVVSWLGSRRAQVSAVPFAGEIRYDLAIMPEVMQQTPRKAHEGFGLVGGIMTIAEGKLYALQNPFALDGRVSSYPKSARGYSVANSYLLTQSDAAMLIDTGFGKDEKVIREQIQSLIAPDVCLSLFPLRLNEFMSINNVATLAGVFNVATCYTSDVDAALWFDFGAKTEGRKILESMKITAVTRTDTIQLGKENRVVDVMQAPIRLIPTRWLYDRATRTLFSSDMFTHVWRATRNGPWIVTEADESSASPRDMRSFLLNTRYWWLEGAATDSIRRAVSDVFDKYDVETIAPGYGCILHGRNVVARHYQMLDEILKACDKSAVVARYVTRDEER